MSRIAKLYESRIQSTRSLKKAMDEVKELIGNDLEQENTKLRELLKEVMDFAGYADQTYKKEYDRLKARVEKAIK